MITVTLHRRLSETAIPCNGVLNGIPYNTTRTPATSFAYWWRWDDDPDMRWEFLGIKEAGIPLSIPISWQGRNVRLAQIARTSNGQQSDPLIAEAVQFVLHLLAPDVVTYSASPATYGGDDITY